MEEQLFLFISYYKVVFSNKFHYLICIQKYFPKNAESKLTCDLFDLHFESCPFS